jgi:hypothetical protein
MKMAFLRPPPPVRQSFADQEEFEEALGFWQAPVGGRYG